MWDIELLKRRQRSSKIKAFASAPHDVPSRHHTPRRARPTLLITTHQRQDIVARCCQHARHAGIREAMTLAEARALAPSSVILPFDPDKSRQALDLLAKWCLRFSPTIAIDPTPSGFHPPLPDDHPDALLLDVTGEAHLFGSEHLLVTEIATRLARMGFAPRMAIAPTLGAAWALSHFAQDPITVMENAECGMRNVEYGNHHHSSPRFAFNIPHSTLFSALASLPAAALRLPPTTCELLEQVGITHISHLLKLPRESLADRFGEDLLLRLDQAFGRADESITPIRLTEPVTVRRLFDGATTQIEAITITVQHLIAQLTEELLHHESGVRGMRLELLRINAPIISREFILGRPSRDPKHLWQLMRPKVETLNLGYGVEGVTLTAYWTQSIPHRQLGAWDTGEQEDNQDAQYAALLDTLINRWGKSRVLAAQPIASHAPEQARHFRPTCDVATLPLETRNSKLETLPLLLHDRPSVLFDKPEPAEALALQPDRPPSWIRWRHHEYTLSAGLGPERIVTAWWNNPPRNGPRSGPSTRDYFKVQTPAGSWLWTFRELETGHWYVHGVWT
jgi:protein ImuB